MKSIMMIPSIGNVITYYKENKMGPKSDPCEIPLETDTFFARNTDTDLIIFRESNCIYVTSKNY